MKKIIFLMMLSLFLASSISAQKLTKKSRAILSFWRSCDLAFKANDTNAIKNVVKLPVRFNLVGSEYGDNPNLNLSQFLKEAVNLKLYNFRKYFPTQNKDLASYNIFVGYTFLKDCNYYEVQMNRKESAHQFFSTNLFIEERKGVYKIFAFGIENPYQDLGE